MTNYQRISNGLTVEKLAELLVNETVVDDGYYGYDGVDEYWVENWRSVYTSCANDEYYDDFEDCKRDTIEWLRNESEV